jgi:hypothetical protein
LILQDPVVQDERTIDMKALGRLASGSLLLLAATPGLALAQVTLPDGAPDPAYGGFYAWYKADNGVMSGKAPAKDGSPVTMWMDSTVNGRNLTRTSTDPNRRPVFASDFAGSGMPSLEFNGDDFIWANQTTEFGEITTARTIFIVTRMDVDNYGYLFDSCTTAGRNAMFGGYSGAPEDWTVYTGLGLIECGPVAFGELTTIAMTLASGAQSIVINGGEPTTGDLELQNLPGFLVGARYTTTNGLIGGIHEVLVYNEELSAADLAAIDAYLGRKYGLVGSCPADFDGDGRVRASDLGRLLGDWGACAFCETDLDGDGAVGSSDLGLLLSVWGECPGDPCDGVDCDDMDPCTIDSCDPVTGECIHEPIDGCGGGGCGDPLAGACNQTNGTPACSDAACCEAVCSIDSFCCDVEWDAACVTIAADQGDC